MEDGLTSQSGGFIPPTGLLSPTLSTASSRGTAALPHPRQRALNPGGSKEDIVRRYVEETLLNVSRRYVKKFSGSDPDDGVAGYTSFIEVAKQLEEVVDMLWRSGTRKWNMAQQRNHQKGLGVNSSSIFANTISAEDRRRLYPIRALFSRRAKGYVSSSR